MKDNINAGHAQDPNKNNNCKNTAQTNGRKKLEQDSQEDVCLENHNWGLK